jgi:hypothetical protein
MNERKGENTNRGYVAFMLKNRMVETMNQSYLE